MSITPHQRLAKKAALCKCACGCQYVLFCRKSLETWTCFSCRKAIHFGSKA